MIDTHCHVDLYPDPSGIAEQAARAGVLTIIVTNLPSAFDRAYPHVRSMRTMRLALGLHPLEAIRHASERARFRELVPMTSYIGEVGLDFSPAAVATKSLQLESFRFVLECVQGQRKFITVHSRRAEAELLDILQEQGIGPVVFHWYSGPLNVLQRALRAGHLFSINPAMIVGERGRKIIDQIPPSQILTETDGPFVRIGARSALPQDVGFVEEYLARAWQILPEHVTQHIRNNFRRIILP